MNLGKKSQLKKWEKNKSIRLTYDPIKSKSNVEGLVT